MAGGPRGRWRRLHGASAQLLAGGDEDEGGEASRQIGSARGVQWPRGCGGVLRRELRAANKTAKGEGEDEPEEGDKNQGGLGVSVAWR